MAKDSLSHSFFNRLQQYSDRIAESWFACFESELNQDALNRLKRDLTRLRDDADTYEHVKLVHFANQGIDAVNAVILEPSLAVGKELIYRQVAKIFLELDKQMPALGIVATLSDDRVLEGMPLVFVVDDSPYHLVSISEQIEFFSYRAIAFFNLNDLFVALKQLSPDALIIDVMVEEGVSPDLLPDFCSRYDLPFDQLPPIVFTSAHDLPLIRLKAAKAEGRAFLVKPIDVSQLIEVLDRTIPRSVTEAPRVLIVDDQKSQLLFYQQVFSSTHTVIEICNDVQKVLQKVTDFRPDVVILDLYMPGYSGLDVATAIRQKVEHTGIQIVFVSAESNPEVHRKILMTVGEAFIQKPFEPEYLIEVVNARATYSRMVSGLVSRDTLTGLLNHGEVKRQLDIEYSRARRSSAELSVVMIDIDHFKQVNDTYGHLIGDKVIKTLALLLNDGVRQVDIAGRYGGEEFILVLPDTDMASAQLVVERILRKFSAITRHSEAEFSASFSAGIASLKPSETVTDLLVAADHEMYRAKINGRNQICCRE